jgi:GNAT superfamily N-acetyltransferase
MTRDAYPKVGLSIIQARTAADLDIARMLMREFVAWHRRTHPADNDQLDVLFEPGAFETELARLGEIYGPPDGTALVAYVDSAPAGCAALRRLDPSCGEIKRFFVRTDYRNHGIGMALGMALLEAARKASYRLVRVDTSIRQREAQALYRRLGFHLTKPYYVVPPALIGWLVFMVIDLEAEKRDWPVSP